MLQPTMDTLLGDDVGACLAPPDPPHMGAFARRVPARAPRIHGELLKLGIDVCQTTVEKYLVRQRQPPSQTWRTFLRNHVGQIDGGVDGPTTARGLSVGRSASISHPRSRPCISTVSRTPQRRCGLRKCSSKVATRYSSEIRPGPSFAPDGLDDENSHAKVQNVRADSSVQCRQSHWRCHRTTVSGCTMIKAERQSCQPLARRTQNSRSADRSCGRFTVRVSTADC
jgi:hypothetical protein